MLQAERGRARGQLILLTAVLVHIWLSLRVTCNSADATPWACPVLAVVPHAYDNSGVHTSKCFHTHSRDVGGGSSPSMLRLSLKLEACNPRNNMPIQELEGNTQDQCSCGKLLQSRTLTVNIETMW